jgi:hypothetical protein
VGRWRHTPYSSRSYQRKPINNLIAPPPRLGFTQPGGIASFFSAHPKVDPDTGLIYNQGVALGPSAKLNLMKVCPVWKKGGGHGSAAFSYHHLYCCSCCYCWFPPPSN